MNQTGAGCASLLAELIGFDTVNPGGDEPALCHHLAGKLEAIGADSVTVGTTPRPGQTGAWVFARFGTPELLVNAHVDTVPANRGWTRNPHQAEVTSEHVYGLGSADTKGAIACILTALGDVKPQNVGILFSGDEERSSTVLPKFLETPEAKAAKHAIVCEPTTRRAGIRHRGVLCYQAEIRGQGGHSSKADTMPKPIVTMAKLAVALAELGESFVPEGPADMKGLCFNIAGIDGGVAFNVVPELARLTWSARQPPGFDTQVLEERQLELAASIDSDIVITKVLDQPPFAIRDQAHLQALIGDYPQIWSPLDFWTEAAVFSQAGIDAVVIGPGDIAQAHAADEFVTLSDLDWATSMFRDVFTNTHAS